MPNGADAGQRALSAATRLADIGFPEFTSKLISDTVDTVVGATIKQLREYGDLVGSLARGLDSYLGDKLDETTIDKWFVESFPDPANPGTSLVKVGYHLDPATPEANRLQGLLSLYFQKGDTPAPYEYKFPTAAVDLKATTWKIPKDLASGKLKDPETLQVGDLPSLGPPPDDWGNFRFAVYRLLYKTGSTDFVALKTMVQLGLARVVFTNGRVKTRLIFDITSADAFERTSTDTASKSLSITGDAKTGSALNKFVKASVSGSYSNVRVRTVNEKMTSATTVNVDILGEVEVAFRTDTFPAPPT